MRRLALAAVAALLLLSPVNAQVQIRVEGTPAANDCVKFKDARTLQSAGGSCAIGGAGAPTDATYWTSSANGSLSNEVVVPATAIAWIITSGSSANLAAHLTNETGTGLSVFNNAPDLVAPIDIGTPTAALTTVAASAGGYVSNSNQNMLAGEYTGASGSGGGAFWNVYQNDGAAMASGDRLGGIIMGGSSSASALRAAASIEAYADAAWVDATNYNSRLSFWTTGAGTSRTERWRIDSVGALLAATDNAVDIGGSALVNRPRSVYVGTDIFAGDDISADGDVSAGTSAPILWNARSRMTSPADGNILMQNNAASAFTLLQFGGTTSSFPALQRSSAVLIARLADGSANTDVQVLAEAYVDANWNGDPSVPQKDAVRDWIEGRSAFRATNSVDQTGIVDNTFTTIAFDTEAFDVGSNFASNTWTPAAGRVTVGGCAYVTGTFAAAGLAVVAIFKNGTVLLDGPYNRDQSTTTRSQCVNIVDQANGTDAYTLRILGDVSSGTVTVEDEPTFHGSYFYGALN